jgi:predicted AAA+ superfamily ATPase
MGQIFENLIILEAMKARLNKGLNPNIYFFRDTNGLEVDILYKQGSSLTPVEIKSSATFNNVFSKGIHKFQKLTDNSRKGYIVYSGDFTPETETFTVVNFKNCSTIFV